MTKYAVLIAPTYVNQSKSSQLPGTFTDIITTRNFLIDALKYNPINITLLTDEYMRYSPSIFENYADDYDSIEIQETKILYPSKKNILYILEKTIKKLENTDELFVQFCGHGIQSSYSNSNNNESDKRNEIYKAVNKYGELTNIQDDELYNIFNSTPCKTRIIFDCCHSATIMDAPNVMYYDINKKTFEIKKENNNMNFNKNILAISGARDIDYSYDATNYRSLQRCGIFTLSLLESQRKLLANNNEINIDELLKSSTEWLYDFHNKTSKQLPHISGNFSSLNEIDNFKLTPREEKPAAATAAAREENPTKPAAATATKPSADTAAATATTTEKNNKNKQLINFLKTLLKYTN
jgi:hypothetical protein